MKFYDDVHNPDPSGVRILDTIEMQSKKKKKFAAFISTLYRVCMFFLFSPYFHDTLYQVLGFFKI